MRKKFRYIKTFEEVNYKVYLNAANKMPYSHGERRKKLKEYSKSKTPMPDRIFPHPFLISIDGSVKPDEYYIVDPVVDINHSPSGRFCECFKFEIRFESRFKEHGSPHLINLNFTMEVENSKIKDIKLLDGSNKILFVRRKDAVKFKEYLIYEFVSEEDEKNEEESILHNYLKEIKINELYSSDIEENYIEKKRKKDQKEEKEKEKGGINYIYKPTNEELNRNTYLSAADKLSSLHPKRSELLKNWAYKKTTKKINKIDRIYHHEFNGGYYIVDSDLKPKITKDNISFHIKVQSRFHNTNGLKTQSIVFYLPINGKIKFPDGVNCAYFKTNDGDRRMILFPKEFKITSSNNNIFLYYINSTHRLFRKREDARAFINYLIEEYPEYAERFRKIHINDMYHTPLIKESNHYDIDDIIKCIERGGSIYATIVDKFPENDPKEPLSPVSVDEDGLVTINKDGRHYEIKLKNIDRVE